MSEILKVDNILRMMKFILRNLSKIAASILILSAIAIAFFVPEGNPWSGWAGALYGSFAGTSMAIIFGLYQMSVSRQETRLIRTNEQRVQSKAELAAAGLKVALTGRRLAHTFELGEIETIKSGYADMNRSQQESAYERVSDKFSSQYVDFLNACDDFMICYSKNIPHVESHVANRASDIKECIGDINPFLNKVRRTYKDTLKAMEAHFIVVVDESEGLTILPNRHGNLSEILSQFEQSLADLTMQLTIVFLASRELAES